MFSSGSLAAAARRRSQKVFTSALSTTALLTGALLIGGCQPPPKPAPPPPPPPATSSDVDRVQADARATDPHARAGLVIRIRPSDQNVAITLASIGATSNDEPIREGAVFTFTDSRKTPIAVGKVVYIDNNIYVVHYDPLPGGHAPAEGDIALHLTPH